jgi:hypothetical protein
VIGVGFRYRKSLGAIDFRHYQHHTDYRPTSAFLLRRFAVPLKKLRTSAPNRTRDCEHHNNHRLGTTCNKSWGTPVGGGLGEDGGLFPCAQWAWVQLHRNAHEEYRLLRGSLRIPRRYLGL